MICDNCKASKKIKESFFCAGDRLHNALEDCKYELSKSFKIKYTPMYQCRYADLIDQPTEKGCVQE